jgi:DNA-binding transcriptional regulator of glucitol operon
VEFESDCLILIQAVTTDSAATLCNYFGNIIQGIKALKGKFRNYTVIRFMVYRETIESSLLEKNRG